jgi:CYRIA/CYRIB Rac1 binding domain
VHFVVLYLIWCFVNSDAQPTENEQKTFSIVQKVLKNSETILDELQQYKGAGKEIREVGLFVWFLHT